MTMLFKDPFFNSLDRVFNDFDRVYTLGSFKQTNITTNEDDYLIQIAVPGLSKEDIKITQKGDILTISYEKEKTDKETFSFTSSFKKTYTLPEDVDEKNITGNVDKGILEIKVPKNKKKTLERLISLN